jgi:membrane protein implicated in regulation of membrane protease activity
MEAVGYFIIGILVATVITAVVALTTSWPWWGLTLLFIGTGMGSVILAMLWLEFINYLERKEQTED